MSSNNIKDSLSRRIFLLCNNIFLMVLALLCIAPLVHVFMISLSASHAVTAGKVSFWPVGFNLKSYDYILSKPEFLQALLVSLKRIALGAPINMFLIVLSAYPLSKEKDRFKWRTFYTWFFFITMLFHGGLIPTYLVVRETGLIDTIWALIIPNAVPVFNVILLMNFFRKLPKELEEAAHIDGAGHWTVLFKIFLQVSKPALATILLFNLVAHWNSWFDGMIYMNMPVRYPMQTYLRSILLPDETNIVASSDIELLKEVSDETTKAAQVFVGALPILVAYPFLQKHFTKGITLGSVKG